MYDNQEEEMKYLWRYEPQKGIFVNVSKEPKGSIFLKDQKIPFKPWYGGCGIHPGFATLKEAKQFALDYLLADLKRRKEAALNSAVNLMRLIGEVEEKGGK